ncbi:MAG: WD40/YVTN/BNR-like repeat-containing protein, partial [Candidatus Kapaibacterium sp.]
MMNPRRQTIGLSVARRAPLLLATVVIALALVCTHASAQRLAWKRATGLDGGTVTAMLHLHGGDVLAGTEVGLFASTNAGASWALRGIRSATVNGLTRSGDTLYAAIGYAAEDGSGGVFRSVDDGLTWTKNLTTEYVWCVAASADLIVAGSDGNGVFTTTDGVEWMAGLPGTSVYAVTIRGSVIYAGTDADGVYASSDGGRTWTSVGLRNRGGIYGLAANASAIVACGDFGVAVSRNGTTWQPAGLTGQTVWCVALKGDTIVAGTDTSGVEVRAGMTPWVASNLADESVLSLSISGDEVMAGTWQDGVFRSVNAGADFQDRSNELTAVPLRCFLPARSASEPGFAAGSGIAITETGGASWQWLPFYGEVYSLMNDDGVILAATDDGIHVSTDGGLEWNSTALAGDTVYAVVRSGANLVAGCATKGIVFSTDNGSTWRSSSIRSGNVTSMTMDAGRVIAVTEEGLVLRSDDAGATFTTLYENVEDWYTSVATAGTAIVVGLAGQDVKVSLDSGRSFEQRLFHSVLLSDVTGLGTSQSGLRRVGSTHPSVFAAAYGAGLFESTNGGMNWEAESAGLESRYALGIAEGNGVVMAGVEGVGVVYAGTGLTSVDDAPVPDSRCT